MLVYTKASTTLSVGRKTAWEARTWHRKPILQRDNTLQHRAVTWSFPPRVPHSNTPTPLSCPTPQISDDVINAASDIFLGVVRLGLDLALEENHRYLPDPLALLVYSYFEREEITDNLIEDILNENRDWATLKQYADFDLVWKILSTILNRYPKNHYGARGALFLSLHSSLRSWIWQHRRKIALFTQLGFGRRVLRVASQTWELENLEEEIRNRMQRRLHGTYQRFLCRKHTYSKP